MMTEVHIHFDVLVWTCVFVCVFVCVNAQQVHAQSSRLLLCYGYFTVALCALREKEGLDEL